MRALLLALTIMLSGCAVQLEVEGDVTENAGTTTCTITVNGQARDCDERLEFDPVHIEQTVYLEPDQTGESRFSFGVGHNASSAVKVVLRGTDGEPIHLHAKEPCIQLKGPTQETDGACNGGTNIAVSVTPTGLVGPQTAIDRTGLRAGMYTLSIEQPPGVAAIDVSVHVTY